MKILVVFTAFIVAFLLGRLLLPYVLLISYRKRLFDPVDIRKTHTELVSRLGGVTFVPIQCVLVVLTLILCYRNNLVDFNLETFEIYPMIMGLVCGLVVLFIVGITDDLIGINARTKLYMQIFVACFLPISGVWINDLYGVFFVTNIPAWIGVPLTVFITVLIINAINLIDGIDGLCSGLVLVGCLALGTLFMINQAWLHALFAFITAGLLIPFFHYNVFGISRKKRKIFMGDSGSLTLGLSMSFLSVSYAMNNPHIQPFSEGAIVVAFTVLIVPVMDVARVMLVRLRLGTPVFRADRSHIHHKLLDLGMSHQKAMITIISLAGFFCIFNAIAVQLISNNIVLAADLILWGVFHTIIDKTLKRKQSIVTKSTSEKYKNHNQVVADQLK
ncbi:MraY family glycosyltransferase [Sphingobacterium corticibacter]|uniref:Undecaprenyl-phosphate alpha-N-acetylglucosaminyl 1-phosphate transferase n=1 Tax=Sphingobacterium corticibacter TaxID=2171749 RepID=A0A2T8HKC5_9SPHI|nr:MraY family glycosyltransferase [Sphingobacterium corticibacter]PVH25843.1 undecaprenyl-phosphate alpha-N-acetylglucosaminyl 1-phosphate transferase [Sphingobacterium corticibacter]